MKRTRIRQISIKKQHQIEAEKPIRELLAKRANGKCEKCKKLPDWRGLSPHEKIFRSHGGVLSLWNTIMLCGRCHSKEHGIKEV